MSSYSLIDSQNLSLRELSQDSLADKKSRDWRSVETLGLPGRGDASNIAKMNNSAKSAKVGSGHSSFPRKRESSHKEFVFTGFPIKLGMTTEANYCQTRNSERKQSG
jgi:hypothetical protein